jgi:hypothetical protein
MKTIEEYLNDPRILNDPDMADALEPVKEIHAARLKLQDEVAGMTVQEEIDYINKKAEAFLAPLGMTLCYDFAENGKLKPKPPVTAP